MKSKQIREKFLKFFESKNHKILPSASLIPVKDPTLLLINAGMAPFKRMFLGEITPPSSRITTSQKCVRVIDIEKIGRTIRHLSFFEMLGNFSFGDYFKKEAIEFAWEFLLNVMNLDSNRFFVSIFEDDEEAYNIWRENIGIPSEKIFRMGEEDNFWAAGPTGPCGPDSEIFIDMGEDFSCKKPTCKVGCECDRYIEVWNLVFMQYNRTETGELIPLPKKNIDTGMGLERLSMIMQNVSSPFETDLFKSIIQHLEELLDVEYKKEKINLRIIADHLRASVFLITDGVTPSNEGRGYILRRLIRRAERIGKTLGTDKPFLYKAVQTVVRTLEDVYPELKERQEYTFRLLKNEEEKFLQTLSKGIELLEEIIGELKNKGEKILNCEDAFRLYDTYGFPLDITKEIAEDSGISVDEEGFYRLLKEHQEKARTARGEVSFAGFNLYSSIREKIQPVYFSGYEKYEERAKIVAIIKNGQEKEKIEPGEEVEIVLDRTPFYAEGGGQIGDTGEIIKEDGKIKIFDTKSPVEGLIVHIGKVEKGIFKISEEVIAIIDRERRKKIAKHHTATHLLQSALRKILGSQIKQAGSEVSEDKLRFDFTYHRPLSEKEIAKIEEEVFKNICNNLKIEKYYTTFEDAKNSGAIALFEEKYEDIVRVVKIDNVSMELCGGTHLDSTGEIGIFKIVKEESIGSGLRRIEAKAGEAAYRYIIEEEKILKNISSLLKVLPKEVENRIEKLLQENRENEKEISFLKNKLRNQEIEKIARNVKEINGRKFVVEMVENANIKELRDIAEKILKMIKEGAVIISSIFEGKVNFVGIATESLVEKGINMGELLKEIAKITDGGGGGRKDFAQAGGKNIQKVEEALKYAREILKERMK